MIVKDETYFVIDMLLDRYVCSSWLMHYYEKNIKSIPNLKIWKK